MDLSLSEVRALNSGPFGTRASDNVFPAAVIAAKVVSNLSALETGCIVWPGARGQEGYGYVYIGTRCGPRGNIQPIMRLAHRVVFELFCGSTHLTLDHRCRNRACVNQAHIEPVAAAENIARGNRGKRKTHCVRGHEYTEANTRWQGPSGQRYRTCWECTRERNHRYAGTTPKEIR